MTGVVIRCQNCGTTQAALGECEACHEGDTRYYCPNHTPGLWLDGPACAACGARVGALPTATRGAPPGATRPTTRSETRSSTRAASPRRPDRAEPSIREVEPTRRPEAEILDMLRRSAAGAPRVGRPPERRAERPTEVPDVRAPSGAALLFGCLRRIVIVGVLLFLLGLLAFYFLFRVGGPMNGALEPAASKTYATGHSTQLRMSAGAD